MFNKKAFLIVIVFMQISLFVKSQHLNNEYGPEETEYLKNEEYSVEQEAKNETFEEGSENKLNEIHLQESENYALQCDIGEEILSNGFIRKNIIVKREISKEEIEDLRAQGKSFTLDETGEYLLEYTSIDMLPEDWIFSADENAKIKKIDSYGNPIINEVDGLPGFAQRDIQLLLSDLTEIYRYYQNFKYALNGQTDQIEILTGDVFEMETYAVNDLDYLSSYYSQYEFQLANLISQAIIREIDFTGILDLSNLDSDIVNLLLIELKKYEEEKYLQSFYKSFGEYEYSKTLYSEDLQQYFAIYGINLDKEITEVFNKNLNSEFSITTKATPSGLYYRGSGAYYSVSSGTNVCAGGTSNTYDDNVYSVSMPFSFEYYECQNSTDVSTIYIGVNGGINVSSGSVSYNRSSLPQSGYNSYICPACDDWSCYGKDIYQNNANDKVFYNVTGAVGSRVMNVNWSSITNYGTYNPENTYGYFSAKIYEADNSIDVSINYIYVKGEEASYLNGIENRSGTDADCGESCTIITPPDNTSTYKADYRFYPNIAKTISLSVSDNTICSGSSTTLTAGTPTGYCNGGSWQYQFETTGGTVVRSWATSNTCSVSPTASTTYVVKARCSLTTCKVVTSSGVSVTVSTPPTAPTGISGTTNICVGSSTTLTATGGTVGSGCTYQWYSGGCGSGTILGTGSSITVAPTTATTYYVRRVGTTNCTNITGCASVTVSVDAQSNAGTMAVTNSQICSGGSTTFSVSGTTGFQQMQYQWNGTGGSWNNWGTSNPHAWSSTSVGSTLYVRSWADNGACASVYSAPVSVSIVADPVAPTITRSPDSSPVCEGTSLDITTSGGSGGCGTITNEYRYNNGSWSSWSSSTPSFSSTPGTNYYESRRIATGSGCNISSSNQVSWTVDANPTAGTVSASSASVCPGDGVTFDAVGFNGSFETFEYKWNTGGSTNDWVDTDPYTWTAGNPGNTLYVRSRIGNGVCSDVYSPWSSGVVVNTESTAPTGVSIINNNTCSGTSKTLSVTGGSLGTGATWHWYTGSCGGTAAGTGNSITVDPVAGSSTTYYVRAEGTCNTTSCASGTVVVNSESIAPTGVSITNNNTCSGTSKTLSVTGGSLGAGAIWHWYTGSCGGTAVGTGNTITVNPAAGSSTTYYVRAEGACNTTSCASGTVVVSQDASITSVTGINHLCIGETTAYTANSVVLGGGSGSWSSSNASVATVNSSGVVTAVSGGNSNIVYTISGGCNGTPSASQLLTVNPDLPVSVSIAASGNPICAGVTGTFTATPTNGGTPSYQWKLNGANVGLNSGTYVNSGLSDGDQVSCVMTSTATCATGNPAISNIITMAVNTPATIGLTNGDYVWSGNTSNDWETASNWLVYDGSDFSVAGVIPDNTNVFLRAYAPCASNTAVINDGSSVTCHDITIETDLSMGDLSDLSVTGDWTNNGTFIAGEGRVIFTGTTTQHIDAGGDLFKNISFSNTAVGNSDIEIVSPLTIDGTATFTNGIVYFTGTGSMNFTSFGSTSGGSANSFVDGPVSRTGAGIFRMPVGDVVVRDIGNGNLTYTILGELQINHASLANTSVEYNYSNTGMPDWWQHSGNMGATLHHVSSREYWLVNSDANMSVSLYWEGNAHANGSPCIHGLCNGNNVFTPSDMTVVYWSGNLWKDVGGNVSGSHDSGMVSSTMGIPFGAKSQRIVTFGSKNNHNPLPVELSNFNALCEKKSSKISWQTLSETNNDFFILEKSNGRDEFYEIARIDGAGNSNSLLNYEYVDEKLFEGYNYYRLKQIDFDGKVTTYDIVSLNCDRENDKEQILLAYPNPFNDELNVVIENLEDKEFVLEVIDDLGRVVSLTECKSSNFDKEYKTKINLGGLKAGVYHLRMRSNESILNTRIVKQ